jgi:hypothetical protein
MALLPFGFHCQLHDLTILIEALAAFIVAPQQLVGVIWRPP